jgi:hypothetical protein
VLEWYIGNGSHWLKRSCKSPNISRTRHATSGASSSRLSRARESSALCMTPRFPVHSKKRVRTSISLSAPNVSWSSSPGHAVVGTLIRWSKLRNISLARALNEASAELCMEDILESKSPASPGLIRCAVLTPGVRIWQFQNGCSKSKTIPSSLRVLVRMSRPDR